MVRFIAISLLLTLLIFSGCSSTSEYGEAPYEPIIISHTRYVEPGERAIFSLIVPEDPDGDSEIWIKIEDDFGNETYWYGPEQPDYNIHLYLTYDNPSNYTGFVSEVHAYAKDKDDNISEASDPVEVAVAHTDSWNYNVSLSGGQYWYVEFSLYKNGKVYLSVNVTDGSSVDVYLINPDGNTVDYKENTYSYEILYVVGNSESQGRYRLELDKTSGNAEIQVNLSITQYPPEANLPSDWWQ